MISKGVSREWGFAELFCRMGELRGEFVYRVCARNEAGDVDKGREGGRGARGKEGKAGSKGREIGSKERLGGRGRGRLRERE